jgi:hypothetical protein
MPMAPTDKDTALGTEELEQGLLPSPALDFVKIALVAVAMLLVFNSAALLDWTRQANPGPVIAALEGPAQRWHEAMVRLGTAGLFRRLKELAP